MVTARYGWRLATGLGLLSLALLPGALAAQDLAIEEIVVTATKRAESVQDVPVAVNAIDADTIEAMGIDEFTDITRISPSLTINQGDWATNSGINLRGIGTQVFSINIEPFRGGSGRRRAPGALRAGFRRFAGRPADRGAARPAEHAVR